MKLITAIIVGYSCIFTVLSGSPNSKEYVVDIDTDLRTSPDIRDFVSKFFDNVDYLVVANPPFKSIKDAFDEAVGRFKNGEPARRRRLQDNLEFLIDTHKIGELCYQAWDKVVALFDTRQEEKHRLIAAKRLEGFLTSAITTMTGLKNNVTGRIQEPDYAEAMIQKIRDNKAALHEMSESYGAALGKLMDKLRTIQVEELRLKIKENCAKCFHMTGEIINVLSALPEIEIVLENLNSYAKSVDKIDTFAVAEALLKKYQELENVDKKAQMESEIGEFIQQNKQKLETFVLLSITSAFRNSAKSSELDELMQEVHQIEAESNGVVKNISHLFKILGYTLDETHDVLDYLDHMTKKKPDLIAI